MLYFILKSTFQNQNLSFNISGWICFEDLISAVSSKSTSSSQNTMFPRISLRDIDRLKRLNMVRSIGVNFYRSKRWASLRINLDCWLFGEIGHSSLDLELKILGYLSWNFLLSSFLGNDRFCLPLPSTVSFPFPQPLATNHGHTTMNLDGSHGGYSSLLPL